MSNLLISGPLLKAFKKLTNAAILERHDPSQANQVSSKIIIEYDTYKVKKLLNEKSPFIYLTSQEKEDLLEIVTFVQYTGPQQEVLTKEDDKTYQCAMVLEGSLVVIDRKSQTSEVLTKGDSFGFDACLFEGADYNVVTLSNECIVMKISAATFKSLLTSDKQFTVMVGSNLLNKQRIFNTIETFRNYVAECVESGEIQLNKLLKVYKRIKSSLHPGCKSPDLDISAWRYAVDRLPKNLCTTFVYFISTTLPDMYEHPKIITTVDTKSRLRQIYSLIDGKDYLIVRELVSDINDLLANLCIHVIESKKLRMKLRNPSLIKKLLETNDLDVLLLKPEEKEGLIKIWGDNVIEKIKNIMVHHEDYKISIFIPSCHVKLSPIEMWTEGLWGGCLKALDMEISVVEAIEMGLVVDFMQGSTRTILNVLSPYLILNSAKITDWFEKSGKTLKSTDLHDPRDKLYAMSYYYFQAFPKEETARIEMERVSGIIRIEQTCHTGVRVIIVNISKLTNALKSINSKFTLNPKSKYHLLVYIGFTFGKQSYELVKNINLLLGKSLVSYTVVGKAGGLVGYRNDILVATSFFDEISKNVIRANPAGVSKSLLQKETDSMVNIGPMLTVSGTVLQNKKMLLYYKHIEGCIGLEMEGAHIALCIKHCIEAGIIREDVGTRFIYYVSDIPLDAETTLASEDENVDWNEGVKSVNGITRYVLSLINRKIVEDINPEIPEKLKSICSGINNIVIIGTTLENLSAINHNNASKIAEKLLELGYTVIYIVPEHGIKPFMRRVSQSYIETSGFYPEAISADLEKFGEFKTSNKFIDFEYASQSEYIKLLHCVSQNVASVEGKIIFLFNDIYSKKEILVNLNGPESVKIKTNFENLKIECPHSKLIFFRTDLDVGSAGQKRILVSNRFDYVITRYKESNQIDLIWNQGKVDLQAYPTGPVIKKVLDLVHS